MNKEEILAKSRAENKGTDEREQQVIARAGQIAAAVGGLLCMAISILEAIFHDTFSVIPWLIYTGMQGALFLYKYLGLRRRHELILAILFLALCAAFAVCYVISLMK